MKSIKIALAVFVILALIAMPAVCQATQAGSTQTDSQQAGSQHEVLQKDVGNWKAELKVFIPGVPEPQLAEGTATNFMVGGYWLVNQFEGEIAGAPFVGHGVYGYDPDKKKFVGTWFDSTTPYSSTMEGDWDESTQTMTMTTKGKGPDGSEMIGKNVTVSTDENTRVFTMYSQLNGEMVKMMEVTYKKQAD